jgi:tellurite resistance protein TerC
MIFFGVLIINKFSWTSYIFGAFLIFTAAKMLFKNEEEDFKPQDSFVYKMLGKIMPITTETNKERFFVKTPKGKAATPLFVALIVIEVMDVVFAVDSVPAILGITSDPFLVFSSNIFAILGLRSMYFFLSNMLGKFSYLEYSLIAILGFIGIKMLTHNLLQKYNYEIPEWASLLFIAVSLAVGVIVSLKISKNEDSDSK